MQEFLSSFSINLLHAMRGALMMLFVVMCLSLYPRRRENSIFHMLFWLLIIMMGLLLLSFGFMGDELKQYTYFVTINKLAGVCLVPLIGAFLLKVLTPDYVTPWRILAVLAPSLLAIVVYMLATPQWVVQFGLVYAMLVAVLLFVLIVVVSFRYDHYLKANYSDIEHRSVAWVRVVVYLFAGWYATWALIVQLDSRWLDSLYYVFLIAVWMFIYRYLSQHQAIVSSRSLFAAAELPVPPVSSSGNINPDTFGKLLEAYMNNERPWLNPDVTLGDMAMAMATNRTYLSEYLNKTLNISFYDHLNGFRVRHAAGILISTPQLPVTQVALQSGFNSSSTLRRAFEKHMGCTPTQYRTNNL